MKIDPTSPTWRRVEEWANDALAQCRARLESPHTPDSETASLRGKIATYKALLALVKPQRDPAELPADQQPAGY